MNNFNWYRIAQIGCAGIMGGAIASAFFAPMNDNAAAAEVIAMGGGIVGFCAALWGEHRALDEPIEAEESRPAPIPESAIPLHEEMRDRVSAARDALSRMVETASRMHHDRAAVHDRCELLEQENDRLAAHVETAHQARDVLALLPAPAILPSARPWPEPRGKVDAAKVMERLEEEVSLVPFQRPARGDVA